MVTDKRLLDKNWRLDHLYKIKDIDQQKIQFKRNRPQIHFDKHKHTRNIILKSRRLGFTTYEAIDSLDDVLFTKNFNALLINYEQQLAIDVFREKVNFAWENLPEQITSAYTVDTNRANQLTFDFGDASKSTVAVKASGKSGTYNRLHVSEFAKMCRAYPQKAIEVIEGTVPAVPMHGRVDLESTAEGADGQFYDMFWTAWNREREPLLTEYKAHFYNWQWDDAELSKITSPISIDLMDQGDVFKEYQEKHKLSDIEITYYYLKWLSSNKDWNMMRQNYPTTPEEAFIGSGYKMFKEDELQALKGTLKNGRVVEDWILYENPLQDHFYCIGADVAEGTSQDSSTAVVLDVTGTKARVVADYATNTVPPDLFAYELKRMAEHYGNCVIAVERNNHGYTTLTTLKGIYGNIYTEVKLDKVSDSLTEKLGWWTSGVSKPKMMYELADAIRDKILEISSRRIFEELRTYDKEDLRRTKFDPEQTKHWDLVMALAIAYQMKAFAYESDEIEIYNGTDNRTQHVGTGSTDSGKRWDS